MSWVLLAVSIQQHVLLPADGCAALLHTVGLLVSHAVYALQASRSNMVLR